MRALWCVLSRGQVGEKYNIGGDAEMTNLDLVHLICGILNDCQPEGPHCPHESLIEFVADRPGHDLRYAIDAGKVRKELGGLHGRRWPPDCVGRSPGILTTSIGARPCAPADMMASGWAWSRRPVRRDDC